MLQVHSGQAHDESILATFFDKTLMGFIRERENQFYRRMLVVFQSELKRQVSDANARANECIERVKASELKVDEAKSALNRRTLHFDEERAAFYKELLSLRDLIKRSAINDPAILKMLDRTTEQVAHRSQSRRESMGKSTAIMSMRQKHDGQVLKLRKEIERLQAQLSRAEAEVSASNLCPVCISALCTV